MSDYISKSRLKEISEIQKGDFNSVESIRAWIDNQPTVSEKEIIRKPFERVVERLEELNLDGFEMIEDGKYKLIRKKEAIEIVKEECGISD